MPFGEEISAGTGGRTTAQGYSASDGIRQRFTRYEEDSETGLNFAQARYQSPTQGRFTSVDPIMRSASIVDPQSFNRYTYVGNNPLNYVDPTGLQQKPIDPKKDIENPDCTECDVLYTKTEAPKKTPVIISSVVEAPPQIFYEFRYPLGVPRTTPAPTAGGGGGLRFLGGLAGAGAIILLNPTTLGGGYTCAGGCCTCGTTTATQPDTSANPNPEDNKPDTGDRTNDDQDIRLYRFGWSVESRARLARKSEEAEAEGLPYGVSTWANANRNEPFAMKSAVEKVFRVEKTRGPGHYTVVLPKPVSRQTADAFNLLFRGRTK